MLRRSAKLIVAIDAKGGAMIRTSIRVGADDRMVTEEEKIYSGVQYGAKIWAMTAHVLEQLNSIQFSSEVCFIVPESCVITGYQLQKELKEAKSAKAIYKALVKNWMDQAWRESLDYLSKAAWKAVETMRIEFYPAEYLYWLDLKGGVEAGDQVLMTADGEGFATKAEPIHTYTYYGHLSREVVMGVAEDCGYMNKAKEWVRKIRVRRPDFTIDDTIRAARKAVQVNKTKLTPVKKKEEVFTAANF